MINESKNIKNESINQITRDNVLALDIAEHCGYYSTHESGTWNFTQRKGKNATEQHKMFYDTLVEFIQKYNIKLIIAEDVCVSKHFIAARKLSEFRVFHKSSGGYRDKIKKLLDEFKSPLSVFK